MSPPPNFGHQRLAGQIAHWLRQNGYADRAFPDVRIATAHRAGGRVGDVVVITGNVPDDAVYLDPQQVRLVVEIVSPGSRDVDRSRKPREYVDAGIPHFWRVERQGGTAVVHLYQKHGISYELQETRNLDELLADTLPELD